MPGEKSFPETTVTDDNPLQVAIHGQDGPVDVSVSGQPIGVTMADVDYEYKAVAYSSVANYNTDLPVQLAVGWHPHLTSSLTITAVPNIVVTYRRVVA